jgi:hypothetical protein
MTHSTGQVAFRYVAAVYFRTVDFFGLHSFLEAIYYDNVIQ